jgi:CHASE2 domain-containing sensor protein
MKRPLGVTFISYFYIFGSILLIVTAIGFNADANEFGIADRFGLPNFPEQWFRIILASISLIIIYGYMHLKRWGYWMMLVYSIGFGAISYTLLFTYYQQPFIGNFIWSLMVIIYTIWVRKSFLSNEKSRT